MVGITSYGAYVPYYRLDRSEIAREWGTASAGGKRAVANWDEDSLSLAVEAACDCVNGLERETIGGLFFASTSSPFIEKHASTLISTAVDLNQNLINMDCAGTLRSGTIALRSAADAVKAGSAKQVLVTAADCRLGAPNSMLEQRIGDGAAALCLGESGVIASIEGVFSLSNEITDVWQTREDAFIHSWEERFVGTQGYQKTMTSGIREALDKFGLTPQDFAKVVMYAPDERSLAPVIKSAGFDAGTQLQELPFASVGNTGAAFALMGLVAALETSKPGERILLASYGDGVDVMVFQVTQEIEKLHGKRGISEWIASEGVLPSYAKYLQFRGILATEESRMPPSITPAPVLFREQDSLLRFHASKCKACGYVQYPMHRICGSCRVRDNYEPVRLSDSTAQVFSYTMEGVGFTREPLSVLAVIDFDSGGRARMPVTDVILDDMSIDMSVEMTFRKFIREGDVPVYGWKCRPIR